MANSKDYQNQLDKLQADYLQTIKDKGQLPTVINNTYNSQEAKDLKALNSQQGQYLQNYVGSYQNARAGLQNIENPLMRAKLAAQQAQLDYAPISEIKTQLAAKAQALSALQQGAASMYQSNLQSQQAGIQGTQQQYNNAFQREQAAQQAAYQQQQLAASRAKSGGGSKAKAEKDPASLAKDDIARYINSGAWKNEFNTEKEFFPALIEAYPEIDPEILKDWTYKLRKPYEG